jgi:lysozyme family protein
MKDITELIKESYGGSPIELAKNIVKQYAEDNNFDFNKTKDAVEKRFEKDDALSNFIDRRHMTSSQASKFSETLRKVISNETEFKKFIDNIKKSETKAAEQAKKLNKAKAVQQFVKELLNNDIHIIIGDKTKDVYSIEITEDGDIWLKK